MGHRSISDDCTWPSRHGLRVQGTLIPLLGGSQVEARRDICSFSEFALKRPPLRPPLETRGGARRTRAGPESRSDLVLLTLPVPGTILSVPEHCRLESQRRYRGKRAEVTHTKSLGRLGRSWVSAVPGQQPIHHSIAL